MNKELSFINPEHITQEEVLRIFKQYPIDFVRVMSFLSKEPGIKDAFQHYTKQYITEFANAVGIEFRPAIYQKLQSILITCLTVGYLTRENLFQSSIQKMLKDRDTNGTTSTK